MEIASTVLHLALNISVAFTVFAYAIWIRREDFTFFIHQPRVLLISLLSIFVLAPTAAVTIAEWVDPSRVMNIAIVTLAISIIPPLMPLKQLSAGGNRAYAVELTLIVAVLTVLVVPLQADLLGRLTGKSYGVSPLDLSGYVVQIIIIPIALGLIVNRLTQRGDSVIRRASPRLARAAGVVTLAAMIAVFLTAVPDMVHLLNFRTLLAVLLFNLAALGIGHLLGGPDRERALVLALSTASRHPALALTVASVNFPGERFTAAVMLCVVGNMLISAPYLRWHRQRRQAPEQLIANTR